VDTSQLERCILFLLRSGPRDHADFDHEMRATLKEEKDSYDAAIFRLSKADKLFRDGDRRDVLKPPRVR
jgi:hypothetical protein